jgi:hypothetical protein
MFLLIISGRGEVSGEKGEERDAFEIAGDTACLIRAERDMDILAIEVPLTRGAVLY